MACDPWPITWACPTEDVDPELLALAQAGAQEVLWAFGGGRVGICEHTEAYRPPRGGGQCVPPVSGDQWPRNCCRILLHHRPIVEVIEVYVNGELLDLDGFTWDGSYLRRVGACWPTASECDVPPVRVDYRAGRNLPALTAMAMGEVACELLAAMQGKPCKLPSRAVSIARQGVTVELQSADQVTANGKLGLAIADAWLDIVNPDGRSGRRHSAVLSPDMARRS